MNRVLRSYPCIEIRPRHASRIQPSLGGNRTCVCVPREIRLRDSRSAVRANGRYLRYLGDIRRAGRERPCITAREHRRVIPAVKSARSKRTRARADPPRSPERGRDYAAIN